MFSLFKYTQIVIKVVFNNMFINKIKFKYIYLRNTDINGVGVIKINSQVSTLYFCYTSLYI